MSTYSAARRRLPSKILVGAAVAALTSSVLGIAAPAHAASTSPLPVFIENGNAGMDPASALTSGWWGHEGAGRNGTSSFSADGKGGASSVTSTTIASQLHKIAPDANASNLYVAYVLTSADGSTERPAVTSGETVGQAFQWFDGGSILNGVSGTTLLNDYVDILSTQASFTDWTAHGSPAMNFDNNLNPVDSTGAAQSHPEGKSILNNWAAGTQVSLVYYVAATDSAGNPILVNNEPTVAVGADGHAETAWMPFTTVALPADHTHDPTNGCGSGTNPSPCPASYDSVRTSAGYTVAGVAVAPKVTLSHTWSGTSGMLKAGLTNAITGAALTNATGSIQFNARPVNATAGAWTPYGAPVSVSSAGIATAPITGLTAGQNREFEAVYTPDAAASSIYTTATSNLNQAFAPAKKAASITATLRPVNGRITRGMRPKLTVVVKTTGLVPTGSVTILVVEPNRKTVTVRLALRSGVASCLLPAALRGTTKIAIRYSGNAWINAASKTIAFTVR